VASGSRLFPSKAELNVFRSIRRQAVVWPVLSVAFFAIAIYLVRVVEELPAFDNNEVQWVGVSFDPNSRPPCVPASMICAMADAAKPDAVGASYLASTAGSWITFALPPGSFVISLNNLTGDSCKIYPGLHKISDIISSPNKFKKTEVKAEKYGGSLGLSRLTVHLARDSSVENYRIVCELQSVRQSYTFSKYQVALYLEDEDSPNSNAVAQPISAIQKVTFNFADVPAADQFSFDGGTWPEKMQNVEAARVMSPGNRLVVRWTDDGREQFKEVLLIVIGTLIAFGVGTFIEWIRPVVDD
jgi:hypothetical protein